MQTVYVSSKIAAHWWEEPPQTIYRSDAQCLHSQLVLVGKCLHEVCFSRQFFHVLNEYKQKSKSNTNYQPWYSKSLTTPRTTAFSSTIITVGLGEYCLLTYLLQYMRKQSHIAVVLTRGHMPVRHKSYSCIWVFYLLNKGFSPPSQTIYERRNRSLGYKPNRDTCMKIVHTWCW